MTRIKRAQITVIVFVMTALLVLFAGGNVFLEFAMIVFGSITVLFLPGYWIVECSFGKLDFVERIALSFALSISVIPIFTYLIGLVNLPVSAMSILVMIAGIIGVALIILFKPKLFK